MAEMDLPRQYLVSAFLAMEPPECIISLAKKCGDGLLSEDVQQFIWTHCINRDDENCHVPYLKSLLRKLIKEVESSGGNVLDEYYERYADYMSSLKEDGPGRGNSWISKCISFLFHHVPGDSGQRQMVVPLKCSLNMLQGDTGCALWPSSLFLSEFVLSFPEVFTRKSCFEVGSGVGLLGVCLQHVKASQVILTDGDVSTLANLKVNLAMNKIGLTDVSSDETTSSRDVVQCVHLPWESARESKLQQFMPDIVLGADVIYDPSCLPDLVRVLSILLNRRKTVDRKPIDCDPGLVLFGNGNNINKANNVSDDTNVHNENVDYDNEEPLELGEVKQAAAMETLVRELQSGPVALIASVIRNVDTFNCFLSISRQANLLVRDLTESVRFSNLIPYMGSYNRSDVHLFLLSHLPK